MSFEEFRSYFDAAFSEYLRQKITIFSQESSSAEVARIAQYAQEVSAGGKRFRPYLAYLALDVSDPKDHMHLLYAIELLHVFALVHDDIMDDGTTRHGVACAHRKFTELYGMSRIGEGVAILLGDVIYQWSYESLFSYVQEHTQYGGLVSTIWGELIREVIHGQMIDVISPTQPPFSQELIEQKMYLKTARYSFVQPLRLGFAARGVLAEQEQFATSFGKSLGLMFQLQDDLIDVTRGHDKSSFLDIETNQQTLLSWFMQTQAPEQYRAQFGSYVGTKLTPIDQETLATLLSESGARAYVQERIDTYYKDALALADTPVWQALASMVYTRSK